MRVHISNDPEINFLSTLFVRFPLAYGQVEARLFALALGSLAAQSQHVTFQLAYNDVIPGGNADGQRDDKLQVAIQRLLQPIDNRLLYEENRRFQLLYLFSRLGWDSSSELVMGEFNPELGEYLLDLGGRYTTAELEALLMLR